MKSVKGKQAKSTHTMLLVSWANLHTKSISLGTYVLICRLFSTSQMLQRRLTCYRWMNYFFDRMINVSSHAGIVRSRHGQNRHRFPACSTDGTSFFNTNVYTSLQK